MTPTPQALKVLVVEDDTHTRAIIVGLLTQLGVGSIAQAGDGYAGYSELLRTRPDLVLCDVNMKPIDGRAFLRQVRAAKLPGIAETQVVFLTADTQRDTVLFAKEYAVNGYLVKPVSRSDLKSALDRVLAVLAKKETKPPAF